ncbi:hypothetical protein F4604DRAFT_1791289 [Suillus subluteus]|nr:hypothetical protein F4604DRAFT_1791289 [Suillus subluteus]
MSTSAAWFGFFTCTGTLTTAPPSSLRTFLRPRAFEFGKHHCSISSIEILRTLSGTQEVEWGDEWNYPNEFFRLLRDYVYIT